ncbi:MAG: hypothetical protein MUO54_16430 [Anaerolineales bacterium]|nr:hypothetical protein [Anaerolineales bacterium]
MSQTGKYPRVIILYLVLAFFSIPHLIDDFLFDIPVEFGISVHMTQFLAGVFILIYLGILIPLDRGQKGGVIGAISMGIFLALAGILKHIPLIIKPGPYWSGWFSEGLIFGMIVSGISLAGAGIIAIRRSGKS